MPLIKAIEGAQTTERRRFTTVNVLLIGGIVALLWSCSFVAPTGSAWAPASTVSTITTYEKTVTAPRRWRHVITCLAPAIDEQLCKRIAEIDEGLRDNGTADIVIFHGDFPDKDTATSLKKSTTRRLEMVHVESLFWEFPKGFDPYLENPNARKRTKWGYQQVNNELASCRRISKHTIKPTITTLQNVQMIKFFYRDIFRLPMFKDVKYIMRVDDDSCFPSGLPDVFQVMPVSKRDIVFLFSTPTSHYF